jgi:hypothetical protein
MASSITHKAAVSDLKSTTYFPLTCLQGHVISYNDTHVLNVSEFEYFGPNIKSAGLSQEVVIPVQC